MGFFERNGASPAAPQSSRGGPAQGWKRTSADFPRATLKTHTPGSRMQVRGQRFYEPQNGRWLSRDPVAELAGAANVFTWTINEGVGKIDYLGLWVIERKGGRTAVATAEEGDTIGGLSKRIGLRQAEYKSWLTAQDAGGALPSGPDEAVCGKFDIPNEVVMFWAESAWKKYPHSWSSSADHLRKLGFSVYQEDVAGGSLKLYQLQIILRKKSKAKTLHGLVYDGHTGGVFRLIDSTDALDQTEQQEWKPVLDRRLPVAEYHMALGLMFTCWANEFAGLFSTPQEGAILFLPKGSFKPKTSIFPAQQYIKPGDQGTPP